MANSFQEEQERPELVTVAELAENLVYRLPGCTDLMIRKAIQDVCREFCRETKCLTADRVLPLEDGETDYPVTPVYGGIVGEVREVSLCGRRLVGGRDFCLSTGSCVVVRLDRRFVQPEGNVPPAEEHIHGRERHLRVRATEYPKLGSERVPSWFVARHGEAVCSGVLARLCAMTGRAWTDPSVAADERLRYENAKSEARMFREVPPGGRFIDTSHIL